MSLSDEFIRLARAHAYRRKLKIKRGRYVSAGWHLLGSGWFGEAWEHADYPGLVVKVSGRGGFGRRAPHTPDVDITADSWQVFAQYCHKHPHEHLPKIMHFERINAAVAWAIMPKYRQCKRSGPDEHVALRRKWQGWLNGERDAPEWMWPVIGMAESLCMTVDLHGDNVMLDSGGTLIMTDPFSGIIT